MWSKQKISRCGPLRPLSSGIHPTWKLGCIARDCELGEGEDWLRFIMAVGDKTEPKEDLSLDCRRTNSIRAARVQGPPCTRFCRETPNSASKSQAMSATSSGTLCQYLPATSEDEARSRSTRQPLLRAAGRQNFLLQGPSKTYQTGPAAKMLEVSWQQRSIPSSCVPVSSPGSLHSSRDLKNGQQAPSAVDELFPNRSEEGIRLHEQKRREREKWCHGCRSLTGTTHRQFSVTGIMNPGGYQPLSSQSCQDRARKAMPRGRTASQMHQGADWLL